MRAIGAASATLDLMLQRVTDPAKKTFGKYLHEHGEYPKSPSVDTSNANPPSGSVIADIARSRAEIESSRLLVLSAALQIDNFTAKGALKEIGIAKVNTYFRPLRLHGS